MYFEFLAQTKNTQKTLRCEQTDYLHSSHLTQIKKL